MANPRICSIHGCGKKSKAHGLCRAHYWHLRKYGDPLGKSDRETTGGWIAAHKDYQSDDCLIWPFSRANNGYGKAHVGKSQSAHRLMCVVAHGPAPSRRHVAAHSCGNGKDGCVNPRHLRWATQSENEMDKATHGTMPRGGRHHNAKLAEHEVLEILSCAGEVSLADLARRFGVATPTIWKIVHNVGWKHIHS